MEKVLSLALILGLLAGCATNKIEARRREKAASFGALTPEFQELVRQGQIRRGMSPDAVYIAWGQPAQILEQEDQQGSLTVWLYHGNWSEEVRYWPYQSRVPSTDYNIRTYIRAEVSFVNNAVTTWRILPKPTY